MFLSFNMEYYDKSFNISGWDITKGEYLWLGYQQK